MQPLKIALHIDDSILKRVNRCARQPSHTRDTSHFAFNKAYDSKETAKKLNLNHKRKLNHQAQLPQKPDIDRCRKIEANGIQL